MTDARSDIFLQSVTDSEISPILNTVSAVVLLLSRGKPGTNASSECRADRGKEASDTETCPVRWFGASLLNCR